MTTIRKIGFFVSLAVLFSIPASVEAQYRFNSPSSAGYGFSLSPLLGAIYGQAEEIVYKYPDSKVYMSELLWDLKPLWYAGLAINFGLCDPYEKSGFIVNASVRAGLPLETGVLNDRDWEYGDNSLTKFSRHNTKSRGSILADISGGYSFRLNNFFLVAAHLEFLYMRHSWSAFNGYYQYLNTNNFGIIAPGQIWTNDIPKVYLDGEVIRYVQNWFILSPGVSLKGRINRFFGLEGFFNYSPLIYCSDRDDHFFTDTVFYDQNYYGHYINGGGKITLSPHRNFDLSIVYSYKYITGTRGDMISNQFSFKNIAGAGYSAMDIGIIGKINLFKY